MTFKIEQIPWNKGIKNFRGDYKLTEEHKRKIGKANKGKPNKFKGIPRSEETKRKISLHRKGFKFSLKAREKMSKSHIGIQANEKHPMWKGGISREPYGQEWTKTLKEAIRQRDQYKCRLCECPQEECIEKLNIHHIDYDKKNLNPTNLISLCRKCHSKTVSNREKWISLLSSRIKQVIIISFILLSFNLSNALAVVDIDLMEYPTNALAQAAYPSSEVDVVDQQQTTSDQGYYLGDYADNERRVAQGFQVSGNI